MTRTIRPAIQLHCARCGLLINARTPWLQPRLCPRCLAYAHTAAKLAPLPTAPSETQARSPQAPAPTH
jgi:hypothetical protein